MKKNATRETAARAEKTATEEETIAETEMTTEGTTEETTETIAMPRLKLHLQ